MSTENERCKHGNMHENTCLECDEERAVPPPPSPPTWCEHIIHWGNEWYLYAQKPPCRASPWNHCPICGTKRPEEARPLPSPPPFPGNRFKAKGTGLRWPIDATRFVNVQPGEQGDVFLTWINGENQVNVRLTKEAAAMTAMALLHFGRNLLPDCDGEPVA
jgi:hypothetical protein